MSLYKGFLSIFQHSGADAVMCNQRPLSTVDYNEGSAALILLAGRSINTAKTECSAMLTIPEDDPTADLFEPAPGPAPEQYDLFTEEDGTEELQQIATTTAHDRPTSFTG